MSGPTMLPAAPLVEFVARRGGIDTVLKLKGRNCTNGTALPAYPGAHHLLRTWNRGRARGSWSLAWIDDFCVRVVGVVPELIYGDDWWD